MSTYEDKALYSRISNSNKYYVMDLEQLYISKKKKETTVYVN